MDVISEALPKRIIELRVNPKLQTSDFTIHCMWIEALPYEDGDDCAFYAIQEALIHFNHTALDLPTRTKFQEERIKQVNLYKKIAGVDNELGAYLKISLAWLLPKLEKAGIVPERFVCTDSTRQIIESSKQLRKYESLIHEQHENAKAKADPLFPALFFLEREDGEHVWFCPDAKTFKKDEQYHKGSKDYYVLIAKMKKAK